MEGCYYVVCLFRVARHIARFILGRWAICVYYLLVHCTSYKRQRLQQSARHHWMRKLSRQSGNINLDKWGRGESLRDDGYYASRYESFLHMLYSLVDWTLTWFLFLKDLGNMFVIKGSRLSRGIWQERANGRFTETSQYFLWSTE